MDERMAELVLRAAELIPPGSVASYGDLAELVGTSPRHVGRIMAVHGSGVAWWRVTNHSGDFPPHLREEAAVHWAEEGITWKPNRLGCRISVYRTDLTELADAFETLPPLPESPEDPR
ncbi:MGMT family protein [Nocardioides marmoribigeumensis]|uniref:Alkylated DNA nucleotide flippase Atl1 n=1 Tax=Nocardioides marmoribigeumensis TaxID=433649 RepID=A0ABU2C1U3_9ACTN|nr:MGMT family protein [Nocardioides marmoribigeumensis]MDR7364539.1 alkylated DNA nucleotide flippase Atl1 [Nocardioides marmoribigeumensis]